MAIIAGVQAPTQPLSQGPWTRSSAGPGRVRFVSAVPLSCGTRTTCSRLPAKCVVALPRQPPAGPFVIAKLGCPSIVWGAPRLSLGHKGTIEVGVGLPPAWACDDATGAQGDIPGDHLDLCCAMIAGVKDFAGSYNTRCAGSWKSSSSHGEPKQPKQRRSLTGRPCFARDPWTVVSEWA